MFTLVELNSFVAVAEEGSFRGAADRLRMTQPPLSRQIQKLERRLGAALFVRTHAGVKLTPAGRAFLVEAKEILAKVDAAGTIVRSASEGATGSLAIGFTAVTALAMLTDWLAIAAERMPDVHIVVSEAVTRGQLEMLLAGTIDIGLARGVASTDLLATREVYAERLVLAAQKGHPLTQLGREPKLHEIAAYPVVSFSPTSAQYLHDRIIEAFVGQDLTPRYIQFVTQVTTGLSIAASGLGVALVPASAARLGFIGVEIVSVADVPHDSVKTTAVWRRDSDNPALQRFLDFVSADADQLAHLLGQPVDHD